MVKVIAHRGYKKKYPENTMLAFKKAVESGADGIELDVQLSRDGELIVLHDPTLNRTTNKKGAVRELTLAQIKKARIKGRCTERVPVLNEVLHYFKGTNYVVNIEIKSTETLLQDKVIELVAALGLTQQIIISSFYPEVIRRMKTLCTMETALLYTKYMDQPWLKQADLNFDGIHADTFYTSKAYIEYFLAHEQTVRIYTVNREQDLAYWLDSSIDAVITDDVELAVQLKNSSNEN